MTETSHKLAYMGSFNNVTILVELMAWCHIAPCHLSENDNLFYSQGSVSNWSYGAWSSAVVICFGSSVPVPGVHTWGRNWLDFTHVLWADLLNIAYWISEIKQLPILWLTKRMFVRFHAPFNLYESTNPIRFLTREISFFLQPVIPGRNQ